MARIAPSQACAAPPVAPAEGQMTCAVTRRQAMMLDFLCDPGCSENFRDHWILANAVQVQPKVDLRRLERAAQRITTRHDTLRLRFLRDARGWRARITDDPFRGIEQIDLPADELIDETRFHAAVRRIARRPLDPLTQPLAEIVLVHCGHRGDVLITRVHHTAADGTGMVVLTEDLLMLLLGMPIPAPAMSHAEYLRDWELPKGRARDRNEAYWQAILDTYPPAPPIGRKGKGMEPLWRRVGWTDNRHLAVVVTPESKAALQVRAAAMGVTADVFLYTAYAQSMCEIYGVDRLAVSVPVARAEPELARFCGDRVTFLPIIHHARAMPEHLADAARETRHALLTGLAHMPCEALQTFSAADLRLIERGCHTQQFVTRTPMAVGRSRSSLFKEAFSGTAGQSRKVGNLTLTPLDVSSTTRTTTEAAFDVAPTQGPLGFILAYDVDAYTVPELERQARTICRIAGLELTGLELR